MASQTYSYSDCEIIEVIDGDTIKFKLNATATAELDFGFDFKSKITCVDSFKASARLIGIQAPETHGATKARGDLSKAELTRLLSLGKVRVVSVKKDKFAGRFEGDIFVTPSGQPEFNVNRKMIEGGFAVAWDGTGPRPVG